LPFEQLLEPLLVAHAVEVRIGSQMMVIGKGSVLFCVFKILATLVLVVLKGLKTSEIIGRWPVTTDEWKMVCKMGGL